ncbi:ureidoglycolate lyase [Marinobacterium rhizophilum]|uniref:Ureidoglycolate lyase n=1 Tax=Marinobacterium rhizophilum TaxID=420402 RepID=A0ABY5HFR1_9GAMM|nr:ureidoglycolate lyase [Marinobacterium rhizophilum]UTW11078.1 ureidoglycolate lyase [Marinobacterium rhizophilum]
MLKLKIETLSKEAFAPFGDLIASEGHDFFMINNGSTRRYHRLAEVETGTEGTPIISIFRAQTLPMPLRVRMMERHPLGSQAFIPMRGNPFLILVAPPGDDLTSSQLRAFYSDGSQGVNYRPGVWHHPILALTDPDEFLVVDRAGPGNNCDEFFFADSEEIVLDPEH